MKKQGLTNFMILFPVLVFSTVSSGMLLVEKAGMAQADSVIATIMVGTGPYGDLFDPANGYVYTVNGDVSASGHTGTISVIDLFPINQVINTITEPSGQTPRELAFDSANGDLYAADVYSNTVSVIDGRTNTLITSIPTGGSITDGIAYDSRNGNIYAVNAGSGSVNMIDGSKNQVIGSIPVGSNPLTDVFDPDNGYIYVANRVSPSVSVIDGSKMQVIGTITGTPNPVQLSYNPV